MGRHKDSEVHGAFELVQPKEGRKCEIARCRACGESFARSTTRQRAHLISCKIYLDKMDSLSRSNTITEAAGRKDGKQKTIETVSAIQKLNIAEKKAADEKLALSIYMNNLSFNLINSPYFLDYLHFISPAYKPPSEKALRTNLLDSAYNSIKLEVDEMIRENYFLNIIIDESENISKDRIINISINTDRGTFHYCSENMGSIAFTAQTIADWIMQKLEELLQGKNWERINSFATDTCATMLAVWRILARDPRLLESRALFVPCDSHGLQLLISDILNIPYYKTVHSQLTSIITAFRASPKQLALLREKQLSVYGKKSALILSVITRWGTQAKALDSIYRNKEALRQYSLDSKADINNKVLDLILNRNFWRDLEDLRDIIHFIHKAQKMSECEKSHLGYVVSRWLDIEKHLNSVAHRQADSNTTQILQLLQKRMNRQLKPLHWAAYYLDPRNRTATTTILRQEQVIEHFNNALSNTETSRCQNEFYNYRGRYGPFSPANKCWTLTNEDSPLVFWQSMQPFAPTLCSIALRLYQTPANSVPSERSFSIQNLIHNKIRNRLDPVRVNKLTFIYINRRVLDRKSENNDPRKWEDLDENSELQFEDQQLMEFSEYEPTSSISEPLTEKESTTSEQQLQSWEFSPESQLYSGYYSQNSDRVYSPNSFLVSPTISQSEPQPSVAYENIVVVSPASKRARLDTSE